MLPGKGVLTVVGFIPFLSFFFMGPQTCPGVKVIVFELEFAFDLEVV